MTWVYHHHGLDMTLAPYPNNMPSLAAVFSVRCWHFWFRRGRTLCCFYHSPSSGARTLYYVIRCSSPGGGFILYSIILGVHCLFGLFCGIISLYGACAFRLFPARRRPVILDFDMPSQVDFFVHYLPNCVVCFILPAFVVHILNLIYVISGRPLCLHGLLHSNMIICCFQFHS